MYLCLNGIVRIGRKPLEHQARAVQCQAELAGTSGEVGAPCHCSQGPGAGWPQGCSLPALPVVQHGSCCLPCSALPPSPPPSCFPSPASRAGMWVPTLVAQAHSLHQEGQGSHQSRCPCRGFGEG